MRDPFSENATEETKPAEAVSRSAVEAIHMSRSRSELGRSINLQP